MKMGLLIVLSLFLTTLAQAGEKADAVLTACSAEAQSTGCTDKKIGKGLLKCMKTYKKQHKDFTFSDGCKNSMKELRQARKNQ